MFRKMPTEYQKQTLTELTKVASEALSDTEQYYTILYYEKTEKFMDKIAPYFIWFSKKNPTEKPERKSLFFLAPPQLKKFIQDCIDSFFVFKEKRFDTSFKPMSEMRREWLKDFLNSIEKEQLNRWKNGEKKIP